MVALRQLAELEARLVRALVQPNSPVVMVEPVQRPTRAAVVAAQVAQTETVLQEAQAELSPAAVAVVAAAAAEPQEPRTRHLAVVLVATAETISREAAARAEQLALVLLELTAVVALAVARTKRAVVVVPALTWAMEQSALVVVVVVRATLPGTLAAQADSMAPVVVAEAHSAQVPRASS